MMEVYFSKTKLSFYNGTDKKAHEESGSWPSDCVLLTAQEVLDYFNVNPPVAKIIGSDNGHPVWIDQSLDEVKDLKRIDIRSAHEFDAEKPVLHAGVEWSGGFDSAIKLDAAKRLAETAGLTEVIFYDTANAGHALSFADATAVVIAVSSAYQTSLSKKQGLMVQIINATTVAEVAAITW